jgi:hypothetical protein
MAEIKMAQQSGIGDLLGDFGGDSISSPVVSTPASKKQGIDDLLGMMDIGAPSGMDYGVMSSPGIPPQFSPMGGGMPDFASVSEDVTYPKTRVLTAQEAQGMEISVWVDDLFLVCLF